MVSPSLKIVWNNQAKSELKKVYEFLLPKSEQGADNVLYDIIKAVENIRFAKQYQVDEFLGEPFRRLIVRNYRVLYTVDENTIYVLRIFDTRQDPSKLKD